MHQRYVAVMKVVLLVSSLSSILLLAFAAYQENRGGEWRETQKAYRALLLRTAETEGARRVAGAFSIEYRQAYLRELGRVDRCGTCHIGIANPAMIDADQPFRRHPGDLLTHHPEDAFGCTICHQGQGRATTKEGAHGWRADGGLVPNVETPLLSGQAVYTSCGRCHYELDLFGGRTEWHKWSVATSVSERTRPRIEEDALRASLPGAAALAEGKTLVLERGCLGCHKYRGGGGELGPDLTFIGDKSVHDFGFAHVKGGHTLEQWHYEHFLEPERVSPGTVMPAMGFTPRQARSLALYMMSLHRKTAPVSHVPSPKVAATASAATVSGETLYKMFCTACHGESGRGDGPAVHTIGGQPRDFWHERFRYVSTLDGVPTQDDLIRTIGTGRSFGDMPSNPQLTDAEVLTLADYVRELNRTGLVDQLTHAFVDDDDISLDEIEEIARERLTPERIIIVPWPGPDFRPDPEVGRRLFAANCASCHGPTGCGDGSQKLLDERGRPIEARDLTTGELRGGAAREEVFKRIRCGIPGTPMPTQELLSDEDVWQLVHHVLHLAGRSG